MSLLVLLLAACGAQPAADAITVLSNEDDVFTLPQLTGREQLPAPQDRELAVGDGVDVQNDGRALLTFPNDSLIVEIMREGQLETRQFSFTGDQFVAEVSENAGTFFNNLDVAQAIDARLDVTSDFAVVTATGTQFLVVREAYTPLEWVIALDAPPDDLQVTSQADGRSQMVATDYGVWIAPVGSPSEPVAMDMGRVERWLQSVREGREVPEIGEVVWDPANAVVDTEGVPEQLRPGISFTLERVGITLDEQGIFGSPSYAREDCNGDGRADIVVENGILRFDLRGVRNRVRAFDVTVFNYAGPGTGTFVGYNPAGAATANIIDEDNVQAPSGSGEVLSLRNEREPFHYAALTLQHGCFLGFSLTPPRANGRPAAPRPAVPLEQVTATPTPMATARATAPATPTREPTATPTPTPRPLPLPLEPRDGATLLCDPLSRRNPVVFAWRGVPGAAEYELDVQVTYGQNETAGERIPVDGTKIELNLTCNVREVVWRVRTRDADGAYGEWSPGSVFFYEEDAPPPPPEPLAPRDNNYACSSGEERLPVQFVWRPVDDPSGIARYEVMVTYFATEESVFVEAPGDSDQTVVEAPCVTQDARWRVRAIDATETAGEWSEYANFTITVEEPTVERRLFDVSSGSPLPDLVNSWEISDDGTVWYIYLEPDVTLANGNPFTADTVRDALEKNYFLFTEYQYTEVVDDLTAWVGFGAPNDNFPEEAEPLTFATRP